MYICAMRLKWLFVTFMSAAMTSCFSSRPKDGGSAAATQEVEATMSPAAAGAVAFMPRAVAYRTDGDYALNVPVRYNPSNNTLVSFPAPSDLRRDCVPVSLADGWLLDRIGIGENTVYTRYTIDRYRELASAPTVPQLIDSIIPGSRVTEIVRLPFTTSEALADTAACNRFLRGCR